MKKSELVTTCVLSGGVLLAALHHGNVYRDQYRTRAECEADWRQSPSYYCQEETSSSGSGSYSGGRYYGPSYESGARPRTQQPHTVVERQMIKRSGFGFSGARFSAGG